MSRTQKPHFAVDLNEIERQLAQARSSAPSPCSSGGRHDPLADLARIGGQDDPFEALLANERTRGAPPQRREPLFAIRGGAAGDPYGVPAHASQPLTISTIRSNPRPSTCNRPLRISSRLLLWRPATSSTPTIKADTTRAGIRRNMTTTMATLRPSRTTRRLLSSRSWTLPQSRPRARRDRWRGRARLRRGFHVQRSDPPPSPAGNLHSSPPATSRSRLHPKIRAASRFEPEQADIRARSKR